MQETIKELIKEQDEFADDYYGMTLREILSSFEAPGHIVLWGCWSEDELDTVFGVI